MPMDDATALLMQIQSKPVPRAVRFRFSALLNPGYAITIIVLIAILWSAGADICRTSASFFGQKIHAEVYSSKTWVTSSKNGNTTHYGFYISYPYPEKTYKALAPVTYTLYQTVKNGDIINIRYIPLLHDYPYIDSSENFGVVIMFIIMVIIINILIKTYRAYDLLKRGLPILGMIINTRKGGRGAKYWTISYKYNNQDVVKEFSGEKDKKGQVILLVDPNNSKRAAIYDEYFLWKLADDIF